MTLGGRIVAVTGGTGALGEAVVGRLVEVGAVCHVPYLVADEAARFVHAGRPGVHLSGPLDLTDEAAVAGFYGALEGLWASVHLAGGFAMAPLTETSADTLRGQVETNLTSCFLCCRAAVEAIRRTGGGGRLVNVAARPGIEPRHGAGMAAYSAAKAAVAALTQALGEELAGEGIAVNAVAPSIIDTPANRAAMPDADHGAWPKPAEIAETIAFLVSETNTVTRGAVVPVYGRV